MKQGISATWLVAVLLMLAASPLSAAWQAGLKGGYINASWELTAYPAVTNIYRGPHCTTNNSSSGIWTSSRTWVYWGKIYLNGGTYYFAENMDERARLKINGTVYILNTVATTASKSGPILLAAGWYDVEMRFGNGSAAGGAVNSGGWTSTKGFGFNINGADSILGGDYAYPVDNGGMSFFRYDDGTGFDETLDVEGTPVRYGSVLPPYGTTNGIASDDSFSCIATGYWPVATGTRAYCTGYQLYTNGSVLADSGTTNSFLYTHDRYAKLVWQWRRQHAVAFAAGAGGTVSTPGGWYDEGDTVAVTAQPDPGAVFSYWSGNVPEAQRYQATLSFPAAAPVTASAVFGQIYYLRTNGSDSSNGLSWAAAKKSLEAAVATAGGAGMILVSNGVHNITSFWVEVTQPLVIRSVNGPAVTELKANGGTYRRVMRVNHPGAFVSGFTMWNGYLDTYTTDGAGPGGLRLQAGTVSNCVVRNNTGADSSGGVDLMGGLLTHCTIAQNLAGRSNNSSMGSGGGIRLQGGVVQFCAISNNWARSGGSGVWQTGGILRDSHITGNYFNPPSAGTAYGGGVYMTAGTLERCAISSNSFAYWGGGLYLAGATCEARNLLLVNNQSCYAGGGVYLSAGNLRNVTIAENRVLWSGATGLHQTGGSVANAIVYGNGTARYLKSSIDVFKSGGTFDYGCATSEIAGTSNSTVNPLFVNATAGDYRLAAGSPGLDSGTTLAGVTVDLNGVARPLDGNGDGVSASDRGAYEHMTAGTGPLTCAFASSPEEGLGAVTATFTASVDGANTNIVWFGWDFDNNGTLDDAGAGKRETSHLFGMGYYDVALTVSNAIGQTAHYVRIACIRVGTTTNYVRLGGSHTAPYETWAKAASNLQAAVDTVWTWDEAHPASVWVTNGVFPVRAIWTVIDRPMTVRSVNGPTATTLLAANPVTTQRRVLLVSHAAASVSGFTMTGGTLLNDTFDNAGPGGLRLVSGSVSNCVVSGNIGSDYSGGVEVRGGLLTDSVIANNRAYRSNNPNVGYGGGIWVAGGLVRKCVITNNQAYGIAGMCGGGVRLTGGKIENSRIERNIGGYAGKVDRQGGGIYQSGGEALACTLVGNKTYGLGGGVYTAGGAVRSSLVVGNNATTGSGHGLYVNASAARIENVTMADNSYGTAGSGLYLANGKVTNSIAWFNGTSDLFQSGGSIGYSCWSGAAAANGNTGGNPKFLARAQGNYRLSGASPCMNKGANYLWTGTDRDLDGNPRILYKICDMGAYESTAGNATLLIFR